MRRNLIFCVISAFHRHRQNRRKKRKKKRKKTPHSPFPPNKFTKSVFPPPESIPNAPPSVHRVSTKISCLKSETLLAPGLDRKTTLGDKSGEDQTSCCVNGRLRIGCPRMNGHDGSAQAGDPIQTRRDAGAGPSVRCRKHFGSTVFMNNGKA